MAIDSEGPFHCLAARCRDRDRDGRDLGWGLWHSAHLWWVARWVKRDGTIQRVWLLSMTRPSLLSFPYRFILLLA